MQVKNIIKKNIDTNVTITKNNKGFQVYQFTFRGRIVNLSYIPIKESGNDYDGYSEWEDLVITGKFKIVLVGVGFNFFKEWIIDDVPIVKVTVLGTTYYRKQEMTTKQLNKLNDQSFTDWCQMMKKKEIQYESN